MYVVGHGVWVSRVEDLARAEDGCGRWPFDTDELGVQVMNAATVGHSMGESINGVRSHRFLLNNESVRLSPT